MNYNFGEKGLEIKFTFKERFFLLFRGVVKLDAYSSYKHSAVLLKLVHDANVKYGDDYIVFEALILQFRLSCAPLEPGKGSRFLVIGPLKR